MRISDLNKSKPADRYVGINGLWLHYLDWGDKDKQPMLLLHGFMGHAHVWDDFASHFMDKYHIIALDQRGHGKSQQSVEGYYSLENHFADLAEFVEKIGLDDLILMGHSMGGRNALFYTALRPERISRLIVVDARFGSNPRTAQALKQLVRRLPIQVKSLDEAERRIREVYPKLSHEITQSIVKHGYVKSHNSSFVPRYDMEMSMYSERSAYGAEDLRPYLENVHCPVLLVRGETSDIVSKGDAQEMCEKIPNAEWIEIPDSSHLPVQENPEAFTEAVCRFLNK